MNSAYIEVARATIIRDNETNLIKSKVKRQPKNVDKDNLFVFESSKNLGDLEISNFKVEGINSELNAPVFNHFSCSVKLKKGEIVGVVNKMSKQSQLRNVM